MNEYKILDSRWFSTNDGCIGIVAIESREGHWKAYIGIGSGYNQSNDEQHIATTGCKLWYECVSPFFPWISETHHYEE